jgi:hypothetical protein
MVTSSDRASRFLIRSGSIQLQQLGKQNMKLLKEILVEDLLLKENVEQFKEILADPKSNGHLPVRKICVPVLEYKKKIHIVATIIKTKNNNNNATV